MGNNLIIYDYQNDPVNTGVPCNEIEQIDVSIITGDEVVDVILKNGEILHFDSGENNRILNYYDAYYVVSQENVEKWNNFTVDQTQVLSYSRESFAEEF